MSLCRIPENRRQLIVRASAAGCPWQLIADLSGHHRRTVTRICKAAGYSQGRQGWSDGRRPMNEQEIATIAKLVPTVGCWKASLAIGRSYEFTRKVCMRLGIASPIRPGRSRRQEVA